jgi:hypothetical protein
MWCAGHRRLSQWLRAGAVDIAEFKIYAAATEAGRGNIALIDPRPPPGGLAELAGLAPHAGPHRGNAEPNAADGEFVAAAHRHLATVATVAELRRAIEAWVPRRDRIRRADSAADRKISEAGHAAFARLTGRTLEGGAAE